ncbi:MAG: hypothetical protein HRU03_06685 [Nanoarchaeales archaeon]|nr:hypothetical protein [Nanoarchaeales archaeon]
MNYLEDISNKLGLNNIKYIEIHKEVDYGEGGHADNFLICLERYMKLNENEYNSGVEFAIRIINFRLGK